MREIEVKIKVDNFDYVKEKLLNLGCRFSDSLIQHDRVFARSKDAYEDIKPGDIFMRIREVNGKFILNLKKKLENQLSSIEKETVIDNFEESYDMLEILGYPMVIEVRKKRTKCNYNAYEICLDEVEGLGNFIEVERLCDDKNTDKIQQELLDFLESLDVDISKRLEKAYDTMLFEKNRK